VLPWKLKIHYCHHLKFPLDFILSHSVQFTRSKCILYRIYFKSSSDLCIGVLSDYVSMVFSNQNYVCGTGDIYIERLFSSSSGRVVINKL
jgi:hypothetical protein